MIKGMGGLGRGTMAGMTAFKRTFIDPMANLLRRKEALRHMKDMFKNIGSAAYSQFFKFDFLKDIKRDLGRGLEGALWGAIEPLAKPVLDWMGDLFGQIGKGLSDFVKGIQNWWYMEFGGGKEKLRQERLAKGQDLWDMYKLLAPGGIAPGELELLIKLLADKLEISTERLKEGTQGFMDIVTPLFKEFERRIRQEQYYEQGITPERAALIERDREIEEERRHQESVAVWKKGFDDLKDIIGYRPYWE